MGTGDFAGFHFLPPSIHLPPWLRPVHGATPAITVGTVNVAGTIASVGVMLQQAAAADHVFPLAMTNN